MKPFERIPLAALAVATALFITGCGSNESDHEHASGEGEHGHVTEASVTFHANKGLRVPPATAKFIGLQVADVEERKIAATLQFSAQVYRAAGEAPPASAQTDDPPAALASGTLNPADAAKLREGQTVSVRNVASGVSLPGCIVALKRDAERASGQIEALLAVNDTEQPLASGESLSVSVPLGGEKSVVSVLRSALLRTTEGDFVYAVSGAHFVRAPVKLGVMNHEFAEVTDGLYAGDQIVVQPVMTLWMAELQFLRGGKACADGH